MKKKKKESAPLKEEKRRENVIRTMASSDLSGKKTDEREEKNEDL